MCDRERKREKIKEAVLVSTKYFSFLNVVYYSLYFPGQKVTKLSEKNQIL